MSIQLRGLHPEVRPYAELAHQIATAYGIQPVVTSTFRSWVEQDALRKRYERGQSRFPANRPGDSSHNYGLSWDSWVPDEDMPLWIAIRRYVGFRVPERDEIHAEVPDWRNYIS